MNFDLIENLEDNIKVIRLSTDIIFNNFLDLALDAKINSNNLNPLMGKYFNVPDKINIMVFNYKDKMYVYNFDYKGKVETFNYFKDNIEIKEIKYYIKNFEKFTTLLIICKKNELLLKYIDEEKINKQVLLNCLIYKNYDLFNLLSQKNNSIVDSEIINLLISFCKNEESALSIFNSIIESFGDKLSVDIMDRVCYQNNLQIVKVLIKNFGNKLPITEIALVSACYNDNIEMFKELVNNYGYNLSIDERAIGWACQNGNIEIVKELIKIFGNKLPITEDAILWACENGNMEIVKMLVNNYGYNLPIDKDEVYKVLNEKGYNEILEYLKNFFEVVLKNE